MKHKIKIRVTNPDATKAKYSLYIQDGETLLFNDETPGLKLKHPSTAGKAYVFYLENGGLAVRNVTNDSQITINQEADSGSSIKPNDVMTFGEFSIEFLQCPMVKVVAEAKTQLIDVSEAKDTVPSVENTHVQEVPIPQKISFFRTKKYTFAMVFVFAFFSFTLWHHAKNEAIQAENALQAAQMKINEQARTIMAQQQEFAKLIDNEKTLQAELEKKAKQKLAPKPSIVDAAKKKNTALVKKLVTSGENINSRDSKGMTPLMWAAATKNKTLVLFLVDHYADQRAKNNLGQTAYDIAKKTGSKPVIALLKAGSGRSVASSRPQKKKKKHIQQLNFNQ